jgi:hypothetical protein
MILQVVLINSFFLKRLFKTGKLITGTQKESDCNIFYRINFHIQVESIVHEGKHHDHAYLKNGFIKLSPDDFFTENTLPVFNRKQ